MDYFDQLLLMSVERFIDLANGNCNCFNSSCCCAGAGCGGSGWLMNEYLKVNFSLCNCDRNSQRV